MIYRRFGRTELQMPVFSCGGMRYQHKWQDVPLDQVPEENQQNLAATIHRAVEVGVNHIETARGYGSSERQLGLVLPKLPREKLIVQTKVGPREDADTFGRDVEESLERLQLDYVDLLGLHGINNHETLQHTIRPGGCLAKARQLQKRALVRHVGFSTHANPQTILQAIRHERDGGFDYVNLHWYYIYQRNWPAVEDATRRDMGVFIISPSDKGGMLYKPSDKLVELCRPLHPIVFNDVFCLSRSEVHTLSVGAARPSDFDRHLEALPLLGRAAELLPPIIARLEAAVREKTGWELDRPFKLDLPEWEEAPGQINIQIMLWLRNLALAYDMTEYGQMRYNLLGNGGHWFPGFSAEKIDEVDLSPVAQQAGLDERLETLLRQTHSLLAKDKVKRLSAGE
ncbi:MAG: aldo/keto reductase [Phycisphaeraceae bacterium]